MVGISAFNVAIIYFRGVAEEGWLQVCREAMQEVDIFDE